MKLRTLNWLIRGLVLLPPLVGRTGLGPVQIKEPKDWDTYSDTWVATDDLNRTLPGAFDVGTPRQGKTVAMFYFLTLQQGGDGPYDNTKILAEHPEALGDARNPAWGPPNSSHHWGEPLFGYYASDDPWVLRKHALMLANAGVDVVIFDNSNAVTYDPAREMLCKVWEDIRRHGGKTPQIAFLCPFGNSGGGGSTTLGHLYDSIYAANKYSDLWFRWEGKPLVLADPSYADLDGIAKATHQPTELKPKSTLGQIVTIDRSFSAIGGEFPTWSTKGSGMTLSLYKKGPSGDLVARKVFTNVIDNSTLVVLAGKTLAPGSYYLEMSHAVGTIGWWGYSSGSDHGAYENGVLVPGDRVTHVGFSGESETRILPSPSKFFTAKDKERARKMRSFFTYRTPIGPYDLAKPPPGAWTWLQIFPQVVQSSPIGKAEEISVGVAQNYNSATHLAPMSFPGAYGRSYHGGKSDSSPNAMRFGLNFDEQWKRAFEVDPPFVFVTGWNEWTAGFYEEWAGYKAPPAIFVDEFNQENSRDIEPMKGGHGDDYYYQLVSKVRKFKGARTAAPVKAQKIAIDGQFEDWKGAAPEFRDAIGDIVHRNWPGNGHAGPYLNDTGRNDIVESRVSFDSQNVYFYVRTANSLSPRQGVDWMLLYLDIDSNAGTGWLGYDFAVDTSNGTLLMNIGGKYAWKPGPKVQIAYGDHEIEMAIPMSDLKLAQLPASLDFKWADNCFRRGDWTDLTLNGDVAPDDRFNYRAKLGSR